MMNKNMDFKPSRALALFWGIANLQLAMGQYRADQLPVMEAAPSAQSVDTSAQQIANFRKAYLEAGSPSIALFWNTSLTDQLEDNKVKSTRYEKSSNRGYSSSEHGFSGEGESERSREGRDQLSSSLTISESSAAVKRTPRVAPLAERDAFQLQSAFTKSMLAAGVSFVDRATIMRTTALATGVGGDAQMTETKALVQKSRLLLEVLLVRDGDAPQGLGFQGDLKDIGSGKTLASFYSRAIPFADEQPPQYRASRNGFERIQPRATPDFTAKGTALALDAMRELTNLAASTARKVR